jgi:hypothetical protein
MDCNCPLVFFPAIHERIDRNAYFRPERDGGEEGNRTPDTRIFSPFYPLLKILTFIGKSLHFITLEKNNSFLIEQLRAASGRLVTAELPRKPFAVA